MLRIPHCIGSRLTDGGKAVTPTYRPNFTLQELYFCTSGIHLLEAEYTPGPSAAGRIR
jgi:hypothetical protein